jgi:hypothetical protein
MSIHQKVLLRVGRVRWIALALPVLAAFSLVGAGSASAATPPSFPASLQSASSIVMPPGETLASSYGQPWLWGGSTSCGSAGFCAEVGGYSTDSELGSGTIVVPINDGVAAPAVQVALPAHAVYGQGWLSRISCWGANSCIAVGAYEADVSAPSVDTASPAVVGGSYPYDTEALAVPITNGQVGTAVEVALPSNALSDSTGAQYAQLNSVSCDPSGACVAVGSYVDDNGNTEAMVAPITGASVGSAVEVTLPGNALADSTGSQSAELNSVSCEASGACVAVGDYLDDVANTSDNTPGNEEAMVVPVSSAGVVGTSAMLTLPADANASSSTSTPAASLEDVSCPASGSCAAVGSYDGTNNGTGEPMVTSISAAGVALPAVEVVATVANAVPNSKAEANAVGCGAAGCDVVGSYGDTNGSQQPLVIPVSGGSASTVLGNEVQVTLPGDALQDGTGDQWATLWDISCSTAGACLASGSYTGDYQGMNFPGYDGLAPENVNALLVGISGTSVDAGTSAPLPADASADGRLSFGAGVGCGATGSCAVTAVYLQGFSTTTDLINALGCVAFFEGDRECSYNGTIQPYVISAQAPLTITPGSITTTVTAGVTSISLASASTGGWGPYLWSVAAGNTLPAGLSLDPFTGTISGTPQVPGTYTLWVRADSLGVPDQNAEASLTLKVGAAATTATVTSPTTSITPALSSHKPSLIVVRGNLRDHNGVVNVHLRCHSWGTCIGTVALTWHGHAISNAAHLSIPAGQTGWVTVHLNAQGMKDAASLRKPRHGYPTMNVTVVPKLTVGQGIPNGRPMWVI